MIRFMLLCGLVTADIAYATKTSIEIASPARVAAKVLRKMEAGEPDQVTLLVARRATDARRVIRQMMRALRHQHRGYVRFGRVRARTNVDACRDALGDVNLGALNEFASFHVSSNELDGRLTDGSVVFLDGLITAHFGDTPLTGTEILALAHDLRHAFDPAANVRIVIALSSKLYNLSFDSRDADARVVPVPSLRR